MQPFPTTSQAGPAAGASRTQSGAGSDGSNSAADAFLALLAGVNGGSGTFPPAPVAPAGKAAGSQTPQTGKTTAMATGGQVATATAQTENQNGSDPIAVALTQGEEARNAISKAQGAGATPLTPTPTNAASPLAGGAVPGQPAAPSPATGPDAATPAGQAGASGAVPTANGQMAGSTAAAAQGKPAEARTTPRERLAQSPSDTVQNLRSPTNTAGQAAAERAAASADNQIAGSNQAARTPNPATTLSEPVAVAAATLAGANRAMTPDRQARAHADATAFGGTPGAKTAAETALQPGRNGGQDESAAVRALGSDTAGNRKGQARTGLGAAAGNAAHASAGNNANVTGVEQPNLRPVETMTIARPPLWSASQFAAEPVAFDTFQTGAGFGMDGGDGGPDPLPGSGLQTGTGSAKAVSDSYAGTAMRGFPASPAAQVAVQIQRAVTSQVNRFSIHLEPAELGRIDVRLDFARDGSLRASITVERPETLELMQRDLQGLERSLKDFAGNGQQLSLDLNLGAGAQKDQEAWREALDGENGGQASPAEGDDDGTSMPIESLAMRSGGATSLVDISI